MKSKKAFAGILLAALLSASAFTAFAAEPGSLTLIPYPEQQEEKAALSDGEQAKGAYFDSFTGTVQKIEDFHGLEGAKFVSVENEEGMPAKCQEIYLTLEIFSQTTAIIHQVMDEYAESVRYWRRYIPEDGIPLDQLLQ